MCKPFGDDPLALNNFLSAGKLPVSLGIVHNMVGK